MKIAILDDYQDVVRHLDCFNKLTGHDVTVLHHTYSDAAELAARLVGVEALVLIRERTVISESLLQQLPDLKLISQTGKVSNHLDVALCRQYGVQVAEGVGSPVAPAELTWALVMAAMRHIPAYVNHFQQGQWQQSGMGLGRSLHGRTLGIWGYGKIGQRMAKYAAAFDMKVLVWGSEGSRTLAEKQGFQAATSKADFFQSADIVSLHLRLNEVTRACVTLHDLEQMKSDSLLVNTSRAELIELDALYQTLTRHPTKRAAIDVFEQEPASSNTPLLTLPNVVATPHIGYVEQNSYELYFNAAFDNVIAFAEGTPRNLA